jgi:hypothetical protein
MAWRRSWTSMEKEEKEMEKELERAAERKKEKAEKSKDDASARASAKAGNFLRKTRQWSSLCMDEVNQLNNTDIVNFNSSSLCSGFFRHDHMNIIKEC